MNKIVKHLGYQLSRDNFELTFSANDQYSNRTDHRVIITVKNNDNHVPFHFPIPVIHRVFLSARFELQKTDQLGEVTI